MILALSDRLRIRGTESCYQLERKRKAGDWRPFKYYTKFADACVAACEREFRIHQAQGIAEALDAARGLSQKYGNLIDAAFEEIAKRDNPDNADLHSLIRLAS